MKLVGKVAVVAGVGHRASDAIARRLVEEGACVVLGGENPNALLRASGALYGWPPKPRTLVVMGPDDLESAEDLVEAALQAFGHLDVAVSAWKEAPGRPLQQPASGLAKRAVDHNLAGARNLGQAAGRAMLSQRHGHIVIASTRHAVVGLTSELARDLRPHGITVDWVSPGATAIKVAEATLSFAVDAEQYMFDRTLHLDSSQHLVGAGTRCEVVAGPVAVW